MSAAAVNTAVCPHRGPAWPADGGMFMAWRRDPRPITNNKNRTHGGPAPLGVPSASPSTNVPIKPHDKPHGRQTR